MYTTRLRKPISQAVFKLVLGTALLCGAFAFSPAQAQLPPMQHQGSIEYVSGGIGIDESTAFKEAMAQYPLALTFASTYGDDGKAAYVSEVQVVIRDANDADVLNVTSGGPYFLARLAPGHYQIFATYNNETESRKVTIGETGSSRATFTWSRSKSSLD